MGKAHSAAGVLILMLTTFSISETSATDIKTDLQSCTTLDCGATVLQGQINRTDRCCGFLGLAVPFVTQVYAGKNECLRLRVIKPSVPTLIVAVAPGTRRAWRANLLSILTNDNEEGWFTVQVSQRSGTATNGDFTFKYSRYAAANPNCASPTAPLSNNF
jgi:hypothetical protein